MGLTTMLSQITKPHALKPCQQSWHTVPTRSSIVSPQFWQTSCRPTNW